MWHASVRKVAGKNHRRDLLPLALRVLAGVGDARLGQWEEFTGYALHLRRRLTQEEEAAVGPAIDLRGTDEWQRRLEATLPAASCSERDLRRFAMVER